MRTAGKKLLSLALAVLLAVGALPQAVYAQAPKTGGEIIAFANLPEETARQEVPLGTAIGDLNLPDSLTATVQEITVEDTKDTGKNVKDTGKPKFTQTSTSVPVLEWVCEEFDGEALGTYTFTPVLDAAYILADGVELPTITVQVVMGIMALASNLSSLTFDISEGDIKIEAGTDPDTLKVSYGAGSEEDNIPAAQEITLTGTVDGHSGGNPIEIKASCSVKLENLNVTSSATPIKITANTPVTVYIALSGTNTLSGTGGHSQHGFGLSGGHTVTIGGSGSLSATGCYGIDIGNKTQLVITEEADVTARGLSAFLSKGYGIGSGMLDGETCSLTISGNAKVRAEGTHYGIGGSSTFNVILKDNAQVWATGNAVFQNDSGESLYLLETTVTNSSNVPVEGALVQSGSRSTTTDADGKAYLYIPAGEEVALEISKEDYATVRVPPFTKDSSSENKTITLQLIPELLIITTQPQSATYNQGATATPLFVEASVTDGGTLSYQWYSNTTNSTTGGTAISGATAASYTPATDTVGEQYYYCEITNTNSGVNGVQTATTATNTAKITVVPIVDAVAPTITTHPQSATYNQGATATPLFVEASVSDGGTLSYQWFSNTTNSTEDGTAIDGATEDIYIPNTNTVGELYYYCVVTNTNSSVNGNPTATTISSVATVTVKRSGSSSSDDDSDTPVNSKGSFSVYGVNVPYTLHSSSGVMTLELTAPLLDQMVAAANGNKTIGIPAGNRAGLKELVVNFPPAWFAQHTDVTVPVQSGIGGITLSNNLAKHFPNQGTTATVSLQAGSLIFSAQQNGTAITWNDSSAPVYVNLPYSLPANSDASTVLLYNKATGAAVAHSYYSGGRVYAAVSSPGTYEVKIGSVSFSDTQSHAAKDNIAFAVSHGLLSGISATAFSPDTAITRADFVMALGKLAGVDTGKYPQSRFSDVANGSPALPYIEWAAANHLLQGVGNQQFAPNQAITREQMALLLVNYAKLSHQGLPKVRTAVPFADNAMISATAQQAAAAVQQAGIITAKDGNRFDPQGSITRAEASTTLHRFAKVLIDGEKGWLQTGTGQWKYIDSDYQSRKGWLTTPVGNSYYFDANGLMVSGTWLQISGKWYYFNTDGTLAKNTQIDGYQIDANGIRIA